MLTANEELYDAIIRHQVGLLRVDQAIAKESVRMLNATERAIRRELERRLGTLIGQDFTPNMVQRLEALESAIKDIRAKAFGRVNTMWEKEFTDLAMNEIQFAAGAVETTIPVILDMVVPPAERVRSLISARPFEGQTLKEWGSSLKAKDLQRITTRIRIGILQGETTGQITRGLMGTARLKGKDGITQLTRRQVHAVTRTATNHFANQARKEVYKDNADIIQKELFVSTLDSATTMICAGLDGQKFKVDHGPIPPMHFQCRSTRVPLITKDAIGTRPYKKATKKQMLKEFADKNNLGRISDRSNLPRGYKGKYDTYARARTREMIGSVPAKTTFDDFLRRQSAQWQDDFLGKTRGRLYRRGDLKLTRFSDKTGRQYTLKELAIRDKDAFVSAGLDPLRFG